MARAAGGEPAGRADRLFTCPPRSGVVFASNLTMNLTPVLMPAPSRAADFIRRLRPGGPPMMRAALASVLSGLAMFALLAPGWTRAAAAEPALLPIETKVTHGYATNQG